MAETSLSIEEANKVRLAMGLAPLPVPGAGPTFKQKASKDDDSDDEPASTVETRQAAAHDNWLKLKSEEDAQKKRQERVAAIKREREKASRFAKLDGPTLGDVNDDDDDMAWIKGTAKRQKKIRKAEKMRDEFEERERQEREARRYNESDLAGVKVGHEMADFDTEDQILTLKDTAVEDDEDDELEAVSLKEKERLQERLDLKKRKRAYDPNEVEQTGILAQYDEEIDGKKRKAFTLDGQGSTVEMQSETSETAQPKKVAISLELLRDEMTSANDYMDVSEVKIKKRKSKKTKRKQVEEDEDIFPIPENDPDNMEVDEAVNVVKRPKNLDNSFIDDDSALQANLAAQRRKALKKRKVRPEDLARQLREEASTTPDVQQSTETEEPGLVIDETTEFVQNLERSKSEEEEEERSRKRRKSSHASNGIASVGGTHSVDPEGDVNMDQSYAEAAEAEDRGESRERETSVNLSGTGLEEEQTVDRGLGATLKLLKQRGVVKESSEGGDLTAQFRERQKFMADKHRLEAQSDRIAKEQRERERMSARWNNMSTREREEWSRKNNASRDQMDSRKLAEVFNKEYKPTFQLAYVDEHGRHMNQKEAFKQLSHQFHGKGSGNTKTQKHLDKITAEQKKLAESSLDTTLSGGMSNAQGQQSKKHKQAGVRLQ